MKPNFLKTAFLLTIFVALTTAMAAQVQTQTTVQQGTPSQTVQVDRAQVMYTAGSDLLLKAADGRLLHVAVTDDARVTADGNQLNVHDLKPGMTLQRTITTTSTPTTVTTVRTVEGTILRVAAPNFLNLRLADGTVQQFRIPSGQKFTVDGKETDAFGLRKGMRLSATAITEVPGTVTTQEVARTAQMPPSPPTGAVLLIVVNGPVASDYKEDFHMSGRCH